MDAPKDETVSPSAQANRETASAEQLAYDRGFIDALTAFAWSKDGTQFVGSCGMTLRQALDSRTSNPFYKG